MLITLERAKDHLRIADNDSDTFVTDVIARAEAATVAFLNRAVFVDGAEREAAQSAVAADLDAAGVAYRNAIESAEALDDAVTRDLLRESAQRNYEDAQARAREVLAGIELNPAIEAGILLTIGFMFAHAGDEEDGMPRAVEPLLVKWRVGW